MRYRDTGPHERVQYWQGHMRSDWSKGPRPAKFKNHADPTALAGTHVETRVGTVSRRKRDNTRITRRMTRDTVQRLVTRLNRAASLPTWAHNLKVGLSTWLNETTALATHLTITSLNNGQWREISKT